MNTPLPLTLESAAETSLAWPFEEARKLVERIVTIQERTSGQLRETETAIIAAIDGIWRSF